MSSRTARIWPIGVVHVRGAGGPQPLARIAEDARWPCSHFPASKHRHMNRRERHVEEKRPLAALAEPLRGFAGDQIGDVAFLVEKLAVAMPGVR